MTVLTRLWQQTCFSRIIAKWLAGTTNFLVSACPGAGKTILALAVARHGIQIDRVGIVIVITTTRALRRQWTKEAKKLGLILCRSPNEALADGLPSDCIGYVTTYASVANWSEIHETLCRSRSAIVIFDEPHHMADKSEWGTKVQSAFDDAKFRLLLTGTPFRSDGIPIPFIRYENGYSKADYPYSYGDAVRDRVCRAISFPTFDGKMEWANAGKVHIASFEEKLDPQGESRRLRTALMVHGDLLKGLIRRAHEKLLSVRRSHPQAGGLILADNQFHADRIRQLMEKELGVIAELAVSDDAEAFVKIETFKTSTALWLIAVRMVSEGVDIPRLRVGVYATCTVTDLFFAQAVGRFVRWIEGLSEQTAYLFIPADARLVAMAAAIEEEAHVGLREQKPIKEPGGDGPPPSSFLPLSAKGEEGTHVFGGDHFIATAIAEARRLQTQDPTLEPYPETIIAKIIALDRQARGHTPDFVNDSQDVEEDDLEDRDTVVGRKKTEIQTLISKIVYRYYGRATDRNVARQQYKYVRGQLNKQAGIRNRHTATIAELDNAIAIAKQWLATIIAQAGGEQ